MRKLLCILFFFTQLLNAQSFDFSLKSANQQLIENAVQGGIFLMEQHYLLRDTVTGECFGKNNQDSFGKVLSLGVKVKQGYCITNRAVCPWKYDADFKRYQGSIYHPFLSKSTYRELSDSCMAEIAITSMPTDSVSCVFVADSVLFKGDGFELDDSCGKKRGWLVWITSEKDMDVGDSVCSFSSVIYRKDMELVENQEEYPVEPSDFGQNVWGGIYVLPMQRGIGKLLFKLVGVLTKREDKWMMVLPCQVTRELEEGAKMDNENRLTPVCESEKNKNKRKNRKQ